MRLLPLLLSVLIVAGCQQPKIVSSDVSDPYLASIDSLRTAKNAEFAKTADSPLTPEQIQNFKGLNYYPIDTNYRTEATLILYETTDTFEMQTTTDRLPLYIKYGMISFKVNGRMGALEVYKNVEYMNKPGHENDLFVPFKDQTNGADTYGGGRFLDLQAAGPGYLTLDFNLAYNPYCAYNPDYSCPIPPSVNHLNFEIRAGELSFDH